MIFRLIEYPTDEHSLVAGELVLRKLYLDHDTDDPETIESIITAKTSGFRNYCLENGSDLIAIGSIKLDYMRWAGSVVFENIVVSDRFAGNGFGRMLINHLIDEARKMGAKSVSLSSTRDAVAFYEHLGFERLSEDEEDRNMFYLLEDPNLVKL